MKKHVLKSALVIGIASVTFTSCSLLSIVPKKTETATVQMGKFTSVENLYQLKLNSTLAEVETTLGSKPYNILSSQVDGYTVCTYLYKIVERNADSSLVNKRGGETSGTEVYNGNMQTAYLFFKKNALEAFVTSEGRKDSPMLNNSYYSLTKDNMAITLPPENIEKTDPVLTPENKNDKDANPLKNIFKKKKN